MLLLGLKPWRDMRSLRGENRLLDTRPTIYSSDALEINERVNISEFRARKLK